MIVTGRLEAARPLLEATEKQILGDATQRSVHEIPDELRPSLAFLNALKAYLAIFTEQEPPLPAALHPALAYVPESEVGMRNTLEVMSGLLNHLQVNFDEASRFYESAANREKRLNSYTAIPIAMARLANLKTVSGQLHAAFELCQENQAWVERHGIWRFYISGNLKIAQADVLREWAFLAAICLRPLSRLATTKLAARRLTSHSHDAGSVSSRSLIEKMTRRSGVANQPKLHRCASPQHWTRSPFDGVEARSAAIVRADPR